MHISKILQDGLNPTAQVRSEISEGLPWSNYLACPAHCDWRLPGEGGKQQRTKATALEEQHQKLMGVRVKALNSKRKVG